MNVTLTEEDWKLFRKMVTDLRERYLKEKNEELIGALIDQDKTPTEQFWDTFDKMKRQKRILRDCFDDHRRSTMVEKMALMCRFGLLKENDLKEFSVELQERLSQYLEIVTLH
jgi:hypothetical protein